MIASRNSFGNSTITSKHNALESDASVLMYTYQLQNFDSLCPVHRNNN
jgi:hypothetical protein